MTDGWEQVKRLFHLTLEQPESERVSFVEQASGGDDALKAEVLSLLDAHDVSGDFLSRPPSDVAAEAVAQADAASLVGQRLGPYRVVRRIGRGGTGAVYLAQRDDEQFSQRVAIKVIRRGMATTDILQRFLIERQILASIDHPNIARLLDGGSTDEGSPYFVMEYIEGEPIDRYCDVQGIDVDGRLQLFRSVCAAVQVAHQNLVVHRDLKPGNILVTPDGAPKLLDFGIAKLLNPELSRGGHDPTMSEQRVMTPDFASPEQVQGGAITTASDVYSLGVLLFLLLTGHRPYRIAERPMREMESIVTTSDVPLPSTVVGMDEQVALPDASVQEITPESVARARSTTPDRLRRRLVGDLDNIIAKALRKEPRRRYGTVEQLAEDLERYENGLPVSARPDTFRYRSGKFLQRHRLPSTIVATAAVVGLAFAVALVVQAGRVADARDRAQTEAANAQVVNEFMQEILGAADPLEGMGASVTVVEAIEAAVPRIDQAFAGQPDFEAEVRLTIGKTFLRLGRVAEAEEQIRESLTIRRGLHADDHADTADSLNSLGEAVYDRADLEGAEALFAESLAMRRRIHGADHADVANSLDNLGNVYHERGNLNLAERTYRDVLAMRRRVIGAESSEVASSLNNIASVLHDRDDVEQAEALYRESLAMTRRVYGDEHPDVADSLNNLAILLHDRDQLAEAEPLLRESVEMSRRLVGNRNPKFATSLANLAYLLQDRGAPDQAEVLLLEARQILRAGAGDTHPVMLDVLDGLALLYEDEGRWEEAARFHAQALQVRRRTLDADDPELALAIIDHGRSLGRLGRWAEAEAEILSAFELLQSDPGVEPWLVEAVARQLAEMYEAIGEESRAAEFRRFAARAPAEQDAQ